MQANNNTHLIGRLTSDPELKQHGETTVTSLRLAVQRPRRGGEDQGADFIDVTVFGKAAETAATYLSKGRQVAVVGRLRHQQWQADDGSNRSRVDVVAEQVMFLDRPASDEPKPEQTEAATAAA